MYKNLRGDILVRDFRITYGVPSLNANKTQVDLPYKGWANPILTVNITAYEYSMDNGTTWSSMTTSSGITGLPFTTAGASFLFTWDAATDEGMNRYNNFIRVRLQATSGAHVTDYAYYTLYFERIQTNLAAIGANIPFPADYSGIPPSDLMKNAPKT
jgi:hypothetical protein